MKELRKAVNKNTEYCNKELVTIKRKQEKLHKSIAGNPLVVQWLGFDGLVQFLVGELRSHKPHSVIKKEKGKLICRDESCIKAMKSTMTNAEK